MEELDNNVKQIIKNMSVGKRRYEEKKAKKNGFDSIELYIKDKLKNQEQIKKRERNKLMLEEIEKELKIKAKGKSTKGISPPQKKLTVYYNTIN